MVASPRVKTKKSAPVKQEKSEEVQETINVAKKPMSKARKRVNRLRRAAIAQAMKAKYYGG